MNLVPNSPPLPLGTSTKWGKIVAVGVLAGTIRERYYWMTDDNGGVAMIPAGDVEESCK